MCHNTSNSLIMSEKHPTGHLAAYQFKKGQSGNPSGRPKGKTLKDYSREMLAAMSDEERQEYMQGISKDKIWEMAEGKAMQGTDITSGGKEITPLLVKIIGEDENDADSEGVQKTTKE